MSYFKFLYSTKSNFSVAKSNEIKCDLKRHFQRNTNEVTLWEESKCCLLGLWKKLVLSTLLK
jgi:hypothetical protein